MKKQLKWIIPAVGLVVLLLAAGAVYRSLSARFEPETTSAAAAETSAADDAQQPSADTPDFTVQDAEGRDVRLSDHRGKPVVINFWATWCPYCVEELPLFDEAAKTYGERIDFMIVDLTDGARETVEKAQSYLAENGLTFPAYFDTMGEASSVFNTTSIPVTVFIHPDGTVMDGYLGAMQRETLKAYLERLIA